MAGLPALDELQPPIPTLTEGGVANRAARTSFATGADEATAQEILKRTKNGEEESIKQQVAFKEQQENFKLRGEIVEDLIRASQRAGTPLSSSDEQAILNASMPDKMNPEVVLHQLYAEKALSTSVAANAGRVLKEAIDGDPEYTQNQLDLASGFVAKQDMVRAAQEDSDAFSSDQGIVSQAYNWAASMIPLREGFGIAGTDKEAGTLAKLFAPGSVLSKKIEELYNIPSSADFKVALKRVTDELRETNPQLEAAFLNEMATFSNHTAAFRNAWQAFDAATIVADVAGTKLAARLLKSAGQARPTRRAARDVTSSLSTPRGNPDPAEVLNAMGDVESSSRMRLFKEVQLGFRNSAKYYDEGERTWKIDWTKVPTLFAPERILGRGRQNMTLERARELVQEVKRLRDDFTDTAINPLNVRRRSDDNLEGLIETAKERLASRYDGSRGSILTNSFRSVDQSDTPENVGRVYALFGKSRGKGFVDEREATNHARRVMNLADPNFEIKQRGNHYFIETYQHLDESLNLQNIKTLTTASENQTPVSFTNTFIGFLRNPADTLAQFQVTQRDVATFATNETLRVMKEEADKIGTMPKKQRKELIRAMEYMRDYENLDGDVGMFANDIFEFENLFKRVNNKYPTDRQTEAYFRGIMLNDYEHTVRNLQLWKDKARLGIEDVTIPHESAPVGEQDSILDLTVKLEAKRVDKLPEISGEDWGVAVWDNTVSGEKPLYLRSKEMIAQEKKDLVDKKIAQGYRILQVANPDQIHFEKLGIDDKVNFVLVKDASINPLKPNQLNYNPGFHKIYRDPFYLKQGTIMATQLGNKLFRGDRSILNGVSMAEMKEMGKTFERLRTLFKAGDRRGFTTAASGHALDADDLWLRFKKGKEEGAHLDGALDPDTPFMAVKAGTRTTDNPDFKKYLEDTGVEDTIDSQFNLYRNINKKFTGQRDPDLDKVGKEGTENNPIYRMSKPRLIDPLAAINKGLTNVMRSRAMNDLQITSIDHFIAEFGDLMEEGTEALLQNPLATLHNPTWKTGADPGRLAAAKNTAAATRHLLGTPSEFREKLEWTYSKIVDEVWQKYGTGKAERVSDALLFMTKDPFTYARAFAFHTKLGMFNPVQLWLQAQTWSNLVGIAPKEIGAASAAAARMSSLRFTNDGKIIANIASMGNGLGMRPKDFIESYNALRRTGIMNVAGEVAWKDDVLDPAMHYSKFGSFLEKGTMFFKEGERFARLSGWNVAYLQWRKANPGKVLTDSDIGNLVRRTNDLTVNMIRSSTPAYQQGIMSIPTQFFSYSLRMAELYMGGRLTAAEKIRMFTAHSALYGVPVAAGAVTAVYPWYDDVRQGFLERGIDVNSPATSTLLNGLPSTLLAGILGQEYNFGQRYGPGGLSVIKELMRDEKSAVELLGGASASIIMDAVASASPAWAGVTNFLLGREGPSLTSQDLIRAASTVSSVNQATKAYFMVTTGKYITKNGVSLGDANNMDAFMIAGFGLTNTKTSDTFLKIDSIRGRDKALRTAQKEYNRQMANFRSAEDLDAKQAYLTNAKAIMAISDLLPKEKARWIHNAVRDVDVVEKISREFVEKSPTFQREQRYRQMLAEQAKAAQNGTQ